MMFFDFLGEALGSVVVEAVINVPRIIYDFVTGKRKVVEGYRTERKRFVKFSVATKLILTYQQEIQNLKVRMADGENTLAGKLGTNDYIVKAFGDWTVIYPPATVSFHDFHVMIKYLGDSGITAIGLVQTPRSAYTVYRDPTSENLIGETQKKEKFYLPLAGPLKSQFLRINRDIKTIEDFDVATVKSWLARNTL